MKENDVQKVYWAAYEDGEVMESDDGILLISFDKETVEHYPSLPNQVLQVMICRPTTSRPVDAALKSPPEIEGEYTLEGNSAAFVYVCQDGKKIATVYGSGEEKLGRGYTIINALNAALPHCPDGLRLAQLVLQIDKAAREEGLYIGGGYNPKLAKSEQEGPMWKAIKELAGLIAAAEGK